jgi:hypothetical protein
MIEGWTKNLALLFAYPVVMALTMLLVLWLMVTLPLLALEFPFAYGWQRGLIWLVWARGMWGFYARVAGSNFPAADVALSVLGLPTMIYLLLRSYVQVRVRKTVAWKGRSYGTGRQ